VIIQSQIVSLLNEVLNQTARLRKGGSQAVYYCPICHHYKRKLEVNLETGQWHCWTCNIKGSYLGTFLTTVKAPKSYREKLLQLTGDLRLARRNKPKTDLNAVILPEEFHPLSQPKKTPEYKNAVSYLKKRGIIYEDILRYNVGYCEEGPYAYHVIVPSYDASGNLNFFIGRRYYDTEGTIPYKKPEVSMDIIGFESFVNYNEPLNLCEGVFDAFAIRNNAIPLFGKYPSKKLREVMIINGTKRVNMILDDDAMEDAMKNSETIMGLGIDIYLVRLDGKDPSALGFERIHNLIRNAKPLEFDDMMAFRLEI
jgi:ribosomal protein L37AE/L43A